MLVVVRSAKRMHGSHGTARTWLRNFLHNLLARLFLPNVPPFGLFISLVYTEISANLTRYNRKRKESRKIGNLIKFNNENVNINYLLVDYLGVNNNFS